MVPSLLTQRISLLLSNLVLDDLDKELARRGTASAVMRMTVTSTFAAAAPVNGSWPR
jgi:hypothetical protein